jgi:fermentation-respiration switch protein FrsA (DUF1100 family)
MLLLSLGCMSLDSFFFNPSTTSQYGLSSETIPLDQIEEVAFESEDGTQLFGAWFRSERPNQAKTILYFHGNSGDIDSNMDQVEALYALNMDIFTMDYRGYGKSGGQASHDGVIADGRAAVELVMEQEGMGSEELGYVGLSLGGFVATHVSLDLPPGALITHDMFADADSFYDLNTGLNIPSGWMFEDPFDNLATVAQLDVPYLITHGTEDTYIMPEHSERVFEAANEPKELYYVPGATHGGSHLDAPDEYAEEVGGWLSEYL